MLARRLSCAFADTDELVVRRAGKTIREIFADDGESRFRDLEEAVLAEALAGGECVLATGGGIVMREANRRMLRQSGRAVVYLRAEAAVLYGRIAADQATAANRPNLTSLGGGLEEVAAMLRLREPLYREVAGLVVEAARPAEEIVSEIEHWLSR